VFIGHCAPSSCCVVWRRRQEHDPPKLGTNGRLECFHLAFNGGIAQTLTVQCVDPALQLGVKRFFSAGRYLRSHSRSKLQHKRALLRERKWDDLGVMTPAAMMGKRPLHGAILR
jgi:hypothetical protein